ncbi:SAV_915 family protein [Actinomyces gerencseriae]|uniref:SAV_915 family protein n=1 Tax=Actinomyces gerencseriae TaxID=52769 RepID=UPI0009FEDEDC|nr:SAV_915 family protein [Actinomyces gerencseriae]
MPPEPTGPRTTASESADDPPERPAGQPAASADSPSRRLPMPPVVYVPCVIDEHDERKLALRTTKDGRLALLVYTALDRLLDLAGDVPWVLMDWDGLDKAQKIEHYDMILQDIRIPEDQR